MLQHLREIKAPVSILYHLLIKSNLVMYVLIFTSTVIYRFTISCTLLLYMF